MTSLSTGLPVEGLPVEGEAEAVAQPQGLAYARLDATAKAEFLEGRLKQLEAEHYAHASNLGVAESTEHADGIRLHREAMVTIEAAHAEISKQLAEV